MNWHDYFMGIAHAASQKSKDPSTKVGAVIVSPINRLVSTGWNGFPRLCNDSPELYKNRSVKYSRTIHAELNAILFAQRDLNYHKIYCTMAPCDRCAAVIIQSGISVVISPTIPENAAERWADSVNAANEMFFEAGVQRVEVRQ